MTRASVIFASAAVLLLTACTASAITVTDYGKQANPASGVSPAYEIRYLSVTGAGTGGDPYVMYFEDRNNASAFTRVVSAGDYDQFPATGTVLAGYSGTCHPTVYEMSPGNWIMYSNNCPSVTDYSLSSDGGATWTGQGNLGLSTDNGAGIIAVYDDPIGGAVHFWYQDGGGNILYCNSGSATGDARYYSPDGTTEKVALAAAESGYVSGFTPSGGFTELLDGSYALFLIAQDDSGVQLATSDTLNAGAGEWTFMRGHGNPLVPGADATLTPPRLNLKECSVTDLGGGMYGIHYDGDFDDAAPSDEDYGYAEVDLTPPVYNETQTTYHWTIKEGCAEAVSGDVVTVASGYYYETDIQVRTPMTLQSETGEADCVWIDGSASSLLTINIQCPDIGDPVVVDGFTFCHGRRGTSEGPGCMMVWYCTPEISDCRFLDNRSYRYGAGAVSVGKNCPATFTRCVFEDNDATLNGDAGGGMSVDRAYTTSATLVECEFIGNRAAYGGAIAGARPITLTDCLFRENDTNAVATPYDRAATVQTGNGTSTYTNCIFEGNTANDGIILIHSNPSTGYLVMQNCTLVDNSPSNGTVIAFGAGTTVDMDKTIVASGTGGPAAECDGGSIAVTCSDIYGNAGGDWTGCIAGQYGVSGNISEDPMFCDTLNPSDPWTIDSRSPCAAENNSCGLMGARPVGCGPFENIVCDADPEYLTAATPTKTVDVNYLGGGSDLVYGYSIIFSWDGSITSTGTGSVTEGNLLSDAGGTFFFPRVTGTNEITVDCMLLGAEPGVSGPGTMFSVEFTGLAFGTSPVDITIDRVRNAANETLTDFYEDDGELIVDVDAPVVTGTFIENVTLSHTDDFIKDGDTAQVTATVTDDDPSFSASNIVADLSGLGGGAAAAPDDYTAGVATWDVPSAACNPADGTVMVTVTATDPIGNVTALGDDITADNTAPTAVTGFDAAPAHEGCVLSWTNGTDSFFDGTVVRRYAEPGEYPQYWWFVGNWPAVTGNYPVDEAFGTGVYDGAGTGHTDAVVGRNIYYYQAFSYDIARNYGPAAETARDLATNYWLADVAEDWGVWGYDGVVDDDDILKLSESYWSSDPVGYPGDAECDIGPTVHPDWHRLGLPSPDNIVEFEDAMIFAMNYGVVAPRVVPFMPQPYDPAPLALALGGSDARGDEVEIALCLEGNSGEVKGVSASVTYEAEELEFIYARLSRQMLSPLGQVFFMHRDDGERVDIDAVVLGTGVTIGGSGEVAVLTFRQLSDRYSLDVSEARLREVDNGELNVKLGGYESGGDLPLVFRLVGNSPNPFNPVTKVAYHVPFESEVTIRVYDVAGRCVTTLVDGLVEAGRHEAVWTGVNDGGDAVGSGVYFCTMEAPDFHEKRKMTLLK